LVSGALQIDAEACAVENIVPKDETHRVVAYIPPAYDEGVGNTPLNLLLHIGYADAELAAVAKKVRKGLGLAHRYDDQYIPYMSHQQRGK